MHSSTTNGAKSRVSTRSRGNRWFATEKTTRLLWLPRLVCVWIAVVLVAIAACGSSAPPAPARPEPPPPPYTADLAARCARHDDKPAGSPSDYTAPALEGFTIGKPQSCPRSTASIRVERREGRRRFGKGHSRPGAGFDEGCMTAPTDPSQCPVINVTVPAGEVMRELERHGYPVGGPGLGPCGDIAGDYDAWQVSVEVLSWQQAEIAVRLVAEALDRYDIAGSIDVAVIGATCAVAL